MVFEPNYTKVVSSIRDRVGVKQSEIDVRVGAEFDVENVLSVGATLSHLASSSTGRDVTISGLLNISITYISEGSIRAVDYTADFKDKYVADTVIDGELIITGDVVDITHTLVGRDIRVRAIVELNIDQIKNQEYNILTSITHDNVFTKLESIRYETFSGIATDKFELNDEIDIRGAKSALSVIPTVKLMSVTPNDKFLTITGVVNYTVSYTVGDSIQDVTTKNYEYNFTQEIANEGLQLDSYIQSIIDGEIHEMQVEKTDDEGGVKLNITLPILYRGFIFNEYTIDAILDIYSSDNYLGVTFDIARAMSNQEVITFSDKIDGMVSISDSAPFIDDVVGVTTNNVVVTKSVIEDSRLIVEGVVNVTSTYYSKENETLNSVIIDMPFSLEESVDKSDDYVANSTITVSQLMARSRRGKEIEVSAEIHVYTEIYNVVEDTIITDVMLGDMIERDNCVLTIYIVREGDTVWSIAKDLGVSPDIIYAQNDIGDTLDVGEKLIIYSPRVASIVG